MTAKTRFCHRFKTHVTELCQISDLEARMLNTKSRLDRFVTSLGFLRFSFYSFICSSSVLNSSCVFNLSNLSTRLALLSLNAKKF